MKAVIRKQEGRYILYVTLSSWSYERAEVVEEESAVFADKSLSEVKAFMDLQKDDVIFELDEN